MSGKREIFSSVSKAMKRRAELHRQGVEKYEIKPTIDGYEVVTRRELWHPKKEHEPAPVQAPEPEAPINTAPGNPPMLDQIDPYYRAPIRFGKIYETREKAERAANSAQSRTYPGRYGYQVAEMPNGKFQLERTMLPRAAILSDMRDKRRRKERYERERDEELRRRRRAWLANEGE